MTSSSAPTYYFTGIGFNSAFYQPVSSSSSGISQAQADASYLSKVSADTANGLKTFNGGIKTAYINADSSSLTIPNTFNALTPGSNCFPWNNMITNTIAIGKSITTGSMSFCDSLTFSGNIQIGGIGYGGYTNLRTNVQLYKPINGPTTSQTPTNVHIGYSVTSLTSMSTGLVSAIGTYNQVPYSVTSPVIFSKMPIGIYLVSMNASLCIPGAPTTGIITGLTVGFSIGASTLPWENTISGNSISNSINAPGHASVIPFSFTYILKNTNVNNYICPYISMTIGTAFSSTIQMVINNYTILRIL